MSKKSSSSSPVPIAPAPPSPSPCGMSKHSMEEVWRDICVSANTTSLYRPTTPSASFNGALTGLFFQELLPIGPSSISRERSSSWSSPQYSHFEVSRSRERIFDQSWRSKYSPVGHEHGPPASPVLRLNFNLGPEEYSSSTSKALVSPLTTTVQFSIRPNKKRVHDAEDKGSCSGGRKKQRLIKNRESAAKSRARKQAYTDELEDKLQRLKLENAKLRKLCLAATAQIPKKPTLSRTLTAPF